VEDAIEDRESVSLDGIERWKIGDALFQAIVRGDDIATTRKRLRAEGRIPIGRPGDRFLDDLVDAVRDLAAHVAALRTGTHRPFPVDLAIAGGRIVGTMDDAWGPGLVHVQYSTVRSRHVLAAWVRHLVASVADPGFPGVSWLVGREPSGRTKWKGIERLGVGDAGAAGPGPTPADLLSDLVEIYKAGMRRPLPFFPETSLACFSEDEGGMVTRWEGGYMIEGERSDPYNARVFGDSEPWQGGGTRGMEDAPGLDFRTLATRIWGPLLAARETGRD